MIFKIFSLIMAMVEFADASHLGTLSRKQASGSLNHIEGTFNAISVTLNQSSSITYVVNGGHDSPRASIILCQTTAETPDFNSGNTFRLFDVLEDLCISSQPSSCSGGTTVIVPLTTVTFVVKLGAEASAPATAFQNLFFCLSPAAKQGLECDFYSSLFNISTSSVGAVGGNMIPSLQLPTTTMIVGAAPQQSTFLHLVPDTVSISPTSTNTPAPTSTGIIGTSMETTTTLMPASSTASSAFPTGTDVANTNKPSVAHSKGGLSIGAKVGIALGALVVFALLLLGLLICLRRKHAKRSAHRALSPHQPPEQVMLTRSMHTDSFGNVSGLGGGRNAILAEKEDALASAAALNQNNNSNSASSSPIHETDSRHSAVAPYVPLPSLPYSGAATTVPRRKPTSATVASTVSRNISSASALSSGPISPRSQATPRSDEFSPYHDVPIYGDARHSPQVFTGGERNLGGASSPFVTEEMSPEEVARLEEEERRIDLAIAEAERR